MKYLTLLLLLSLSACAAPTTKVSIANLNDHPISSVWIASDGSRLDFQQVTENGMFATVTYYSGTSECSYTTALYQNVILKDPGSVQIIDGPGNECAFFTFATDYSYLDNVLRIRSGTDVKAFAHGGSL